MTAVVPAGPLDAPPAVTSTEADDMIEQALAGLVMGVWDEEVRGWMRQSHPSEQAVVAAWCRRSWQAGVEVGRRERADEGGKS